MNESEKRIAKFLMEKIVTLHEQTLARLAELELAVVVDLQGLSQRITAREAKGDK